MARLDTFDLLVLAAVVLGTALYFTKGRYWGVVPDPYANKTYGSQARSSGKTRNVVEKMAESDKNCVVFYGSQTGTAEDYASRLAKEASSRFGLKSMIADLEDYDYDALDTFPSDHVAFFIMATYGEGEPTDNAIEFYSFITDQDSTFSAGTTPDDKPLHNLQFVAFGLGNNTYEHYNSMVRNVNAALLRLGSRRIGQAGEGDDGAGTMEEDFLAWKEPMWVALAAKMGLEEKEAVYEPLFAIQERSDLSQESDEVFLGEPTKAHLSVPPRGPFDSHNPFIAPIVEAREIFTVKDRNCLHVEIDLSGSNMAYETGDHIAIWPHNADREVDRFVRIMGLDTKQHQVIHIKSLEATARIPFPQPTTYAAAIRYHIEICGPVSRQFIASLAVFAPTEAAKTEMNRLGNDKEYFSRKVSSRRLNIAQVLEMVHDTPWKSIPFSILIEELKKIQPRYYSISSSSLVQPHKVSVTAVVESRTIAGSDHIIKGVATNYLLALKQKQEGTTEPDPHGMSYAMDGPRGKYADGRIPVHIRHSNFKLPSDPAKPIIMVGPGTGIAPFRGFIQERVALAKRGEEVGSTILFYGCRRSTEDYLYRDDWQTIQEALGDRFTMFTAFSRVGPRKVYVQHRLEEQAALVDGLLHQQKANIYVCGDAANMAREVSAKIAGIIAQQRKLPLEKAEQMVKAMRANNQYQEDVWS